MVDMNKLGFMYDALKMERRDRISRAHEQVHRDMYSSFARFDALMLEAYNSGVSKAALGRAIGTSSPNTVVDILERAKGRL